MNYMKIEKKKKKHIRNNKRIEKQNFGVFKMNK